MEGTKMYRKTNRHSARLLAMRLAKERRRLEGAPPAYPAVLPALRREVLVVDHDFGPVEHYWQLWGSHRIDQYRVMENGRPWTEPAGWWRVCEQVRERFPRVRAP
jgi:hypothetical protein